MSRPDMTPDEAWVRDWFARRYAADDVFDDGIEDVTFVAAVQLYRDAVAAERVVRLQTRFVRHNAEVTGLGRNRSNDER
jgi:hypothetical protein